MKLFLILIRSSWVSGLVSGLLGALSGMANLGLIMLIHRALTDDPADAQWLPYLFAGACVLVLITQVTAKHLLVQLSQATAARLRYELCTKIIAAPLPTLESVGSHRLLAALIDDVNSITSALSAFPAACANAMVLVCGLVYLATLSVPLAGGTILMASIGVFSFMTGLRFANRHLRQAREDQDEVVKQLRAMIDGIKELKGNNMRCLDFVYDVLLPADTKMRHSLIIGSNIQGFAHSWGRLFLFIGIGLLLFAWPQIATRFDGHADRVCPDDPVPDLSTGWNSGLVASDEFGINRRGQDRDSGADDRSARAPDIAVGAPPDSAHWNCTASRTNTIRRMTIVSRWGRSI